VRFELGNLELFDPVAQERHQLSRASNPHELHKIKISEEKFSPSQTHI
jgi:hypothetical protein